MSSVTWLVSYLLLSILLLINGDAAQKDRTDQNRMWRLLSSVHLICGCFSAAIVRSGLSYTEIYHSSGAN